MTPQTKIHGNLQIVLFAGSCLIILLYAVLFFGQLLGPGVLLGTSPLNLIIAGVHILYFLTLRGLVNGKSSYAATLIDSGLLSLNISILILATGGFNSLYYALWLLLLLAAGVLGLKAGIVYGVITTVYFLYEMHAAEIGEMAYLGSHFIYLLISYVAVGLGLFMWHHIWKPKKEKDNNEVSKLSEELEAEQLKSEILLKSIGDGVIVVNLQGGVQLLNPAAEKITGWNEEEARNIDYRLILPVKDESDNQLTGDEDPFFQAFQSKNSVIRNDIALINRNQKKIMLSLMVSPIFAAEHTVSGAIGVFRDISAEKASARQRDEFISTASHEMRTPVAAIEGFLALALNPKVATVDESAKKYILKAHESTEHLGKLFRDLLSITKLEDHRLASHPEPFELGKIIKDTIDELRFKAESKNLELKLKSSSEAQQGKSGVMPLFYVNADPERVREVLVNLVDNAIKFTPAGEVNVSIHGDDKQVTVGVHDQGIGIPKDEVEHLFQKFYRVDNSNTRQIGGTGLGLYLVRNIIELYNGRVWVESEEGKGSNFYFSLPRLSYSQVQELRTKMSKEESPQAEPRPVNSPQTVAPSVGNKVE